MIKIRNLNKFNKITLDELEILFKVNTYNDLVNIVIKLIEEEKIKIIKASGTNGKRPALYNKYTVIKEKEDNSIYVEELDYKIIPEIDISYFRKNIDKYIENRKYILKLNEFLLNNKDELNNRISQKERSFQIWQEEKYLQSKGMTLLKKLDIKIDKLNFYETNEPLAYYSTKHTSPQNILIIENMDTFYTFRHQLMNKSNNFFGLNIGTIVYGKGKGIEKSIKDFDIVVDEIVSDVRNTIYYLGDLDFEGIIIYENLEISVRDKYSMMPFVEGYKKMIDKALENKYELQPSKEKQNKNIKSIFLNYFDDDYKNKILDILNKGLYIPQEILNIGDL